MRTRPPHILFLMSDTGGGHRAAARAIEAALQRQHPQGFTTQLVDMWKEYAPPPLNRMPTIYTQWVNKYPTSYAAQFWLNDRIFRNQTLSDLYCELSFPRMRQLYTDYPADIVVCVHSVFVRPAVYALRKLGLKIPFLTVITDYALPVTLWYDRRVDRCLAPLQPAYDRGLQLGLTPGQLVLTGAPIHPKFLSLTMSKAEARAQLGWSPTAQIALMVGGGEGMGPLVATAKAIDAQTPINADRELVVIAGRNEALKAELNAQPWRNRVRIVGFAENIEVLMRAADVMITKAGPAAITEAAALGTPLILSGAIQFQESPNAEYVVAHGAGIYAPTPTLVAQTLRRLFDDPTQLQALTARIAALAQPEAIWRIAEQIWSFVEPSSRSDGA